MSKITTEHLARKAYIYIRQSTPYQVEHNLESKRRQYGLADRARGLGWSEVTTIDEDLGHSGSGTLRSGFEQLLVDVCSGKVGAVLCIEGSRLARNGREWHNLLECLQCGECCQTANLDANERKYTFSLAASMARVSLLGHWPLIVMFQQLTYRRLDLYMQE